MKNNTRHTRQPARRNRQHQTTSGMAMGAGMALFAGAAFGGAMMWLFDPKVGASRRRQISQAAHGAVDQGKDALGAAIGAVASHAGEAAEHLRSHLSDASGHMSGMAFDAANSAMAAGSGLVRDAASGMKGMATDAHQQAMSFADRQLRKMGNALPHDREHHYVGQTSCALGSLAIGAGAVYFLDPDHGAQRRDVCVRRCYSALKSAGEFFNATGRYLRDRIMGGANEESSLAAPQSSAESAAKFTQVPTPSSMGSATPPQSVSNLSA